uniref:uncharacterized protein n=1 Tax=Myxine glutinosa TaxID=7769 RepID=UPI00358F61DB
MWERTATNSSLNQKQRPRDRRVFDDDQATQVNHYTREQIISGNEREHSKCAVLHKAIWRRTVGFVCTDETRIFRWITEQVWLAPMGFNCISTASRHCPGCWIPPLLEFVSRAGLAIALFLFHDVNKGVIYKEEDNLSAPSGSVVPHNLSAPSGSVVPHNLSAPSGSVVPHNLSAPSGSVVPHYLSAPSGSVVPHNLSAPSGSVVPHNLSAPSGSVVPHNLSAPSESAIPHNLSAPSGSVVPHNLSAPSGSVVPHNLSAPSGSAIPHNLSTIN